MSASFKWQLQMSHIVCRWTCTASGQATKSINHALPWLLIQGYWRCHWQPQVKSRQDNWCCDHRSPAAWSSAHQSLHLSYAQSAERQAAPDAHPFQGVWWGEDTQSFNWCIWPTTYAHKRCIMHQWNFANAQCFACCLMHLQHHLLD